MPQLCPLQVWNQASTSAAVSSEIRLGKDSFPLIWFLAAFSSLQAVGLRVCFLAGYWLDVALSFLPCDPFRKEAPKLAVCFLKPAKERLFLQSKYYNLI